MISYRTMNEYLDSIELPRSIEEVLDYKYMLEGRELEFIHSANAFLKTYAKYDSYRLKDAHCIGTCLTNLTRVGIYFLLDDEIVTVHTSNLKDDGAAAEWQVSHYRFKDIENLDLQLMDGSDESDYEAGILYVKVLTEKDTLRTYILRNLNPQHLLCFRDFYTNIKENRDIKNECRINDQ